MINLIIAIVFLKTYIAIGGRGKLTPCFLPLRDKIPKAIPIFSKVSFSTVPMLTFTDDFFTPKFKKAPENRK